MYLKILLAFVLCFSVVAESSDRNFNNVIWQSESSDFVADLSWQYSDSVLVSFQHKAGRLLSLKFSAPFLLRDSKAVRLYLVKSPLVENGQKKLLSQVDVDPMVNHSLSKEVVFTDKVDLLIEQMVSGDWATVEVISDSGVVREFELPAINFKTPYQEFSALRNELPPISWEDAREMVLYFSLGARELSLAEQRRLDNLLEYIQADQRVRSVTVDAHTDLSGHRLSNLTLSSQRAAYIEKYLLDNGLEPGLLEAVRHHGQRYPLPGGSAAQLRRVEIRLSRADAQVDGSVQKQ